MNALSIDAINAKAPYRVELDGETGTWHCFEMKYEIIASARFKKLIKTLE